MNRTTHLVSGLVLVLVAACGGGDGDGVDGGGGAADAGWASERPTSRSDMNGVADPLTQTIAIFGGDDGPVVNQQPQTSYLDDTWVLDPSSGWSQVLGAGPSTRGRQAVAYDPAGKMLIFGGRFRATGGSGNYTLFNDLWSFDFAQRTWTQLSDGSGGPVPRYFAAMVHDGMSGKSYVYGGGTNANPLTLPIPTANDTWVFDGNTWSQLTTSGTAPSGRAFIAYTYDSSRNALIVFGGQVGDFTSPGLSDLYSLDLASGVWTRLHDGAAGAPDGRFSANLAYDSVRDRYIMFGGHADPGTINDVWSFDPTAGAWSNLSVGDTFTGVGPGCLGNPREIPSNYVTEDLASPERRSTPAVTILGDELYVFGGESDCTHLDDTWTFSLTGGGWSELLEARTGESCSRRNDSCSCLCL